MKRQKAIFLDSDGVLNKAIIKDGKPTAPISLAELKIPDTIRPLLEKLKLAGYLLICVTNKPDVVEGRMTQEELDSIYNHICSVLPLDDVFICYFREKDCYKPKPGLLFEAAKKYGIDLSQSYMIGDTGHDIGAGQNAGCRTIWIDRGYQNAETQPVKPADCTVYSLEEAVDYILKN